MVLNQSILTKENQPLIFIERTDAETPNTLSTWREEPDVGKDWRQEEKRTTKDEMVGWHRWLNGRESEQISGDSKGKGSLAYYSTCGCKESDMTQQMNKQYRVKPYISDPTTLTDMKILGPYPTATEPETLEVGLINLWFWWWLRLRTIICTLSCLETEI